MLYGHRGIKHCSYSCLLTWEAVEAVVALNAAIMLVHHSNSCSEEKHSKKLYETPLFRNWVEVFLLASYCDFLAKSVAEFQNPNFLFLCPNRWKISSEIVPCTDSWLYCGLAAWPLCVFSSFPKFILPVGKLIYPHLSDCRYRNWALPSSSREPTPNSLGENNVLQKA